MSSYRAELHEITRQLDLPQPLRARILLELASDLAGLEAELVSTGMSAEQAHAEAVRTLIPSPESLRDLMEVHRSLYRRLVDRFSDPARHRLERAALILASAALFAVGVIRLGRSGILANPAPMSGPLLGVAMVVVVVSVWKTFSLVVRREHDLGKLRSGSWILPGAALVAVVLALGGSVLDLYGVSGSLEADLTRQTTVLLGWLRRDMGLLSLGLLTSGIGLGMWLVIASGIARVEQTEAEIVSGFEHGTVRGQTERS